MFFFSRMNWVIYTLLAMVTWCGLTRPSDGLIAYDCGSSASNITTLSLRDVDDCEITRPILNITTVRVQFLQVNEFSFVHVKQCKIEVHRDIYHCGMHSHNSVIRNGKASYVMDLTREMCDQMHIYGSFEVDRVRLSGAVPNGTRSYSVTLAGSLTDEGKCTAGMYADPYGQWDDVLVQGSVRVSLRDYRARVGIKNNFVYLDSGTRCEFKKGKCDDLEGGPTFWDLIPMGNCGEGHYSVLYEGVAKKIIDQDQKLIYSLTTSDITFGLSTLPGINVCGYMLIRTEHPRLLLHEIVDGQGYMRSSPLDVSNMDIFAYINSKFVYVERHVKSQIQRLYYDVTLQRCALEREMLKNRLAIATVAPDEFAYQLMRGPGYMAVLAGEVVHILKCIPLEVKLAHVDECYTQLPVIVGNLTLFMAPRTHVLMRTGTQISCSVVVPTMYYVSGQWYKINPRPSDVPAPGTIHPEKHNVWQYKDTTSLATNGIYSTNQLEQLREHVMFPAEQPAILNTIARGMTGKVTLAQGTSITNLINGPELNKLIETAWEKAWDKFTIFGTLSAGLIGVLMILRGIKLMVDTVIHGYALHSMYGWSLYLLAAVWNSVANLLLHMKPKTARDQRSKEEGEELLSIETIPKGPPPSGPSSESVPVPIIVEECKNVRSETLTNEKEMHEEEIDRAKKLRIALETEIQETRVLQAREMEKIREMREERLHEERMFKERMHEARKVEERMRAEEEMRRARGKSQREGQIEGAKDGQAIITLYPNLRTD